MLLPLAVTSWAERHLGLVTRRVALNAGMTERQLDHLIASGVLEVIHPGVYRIAGVPPTWEGDLSAACLAVGGLTVASHRAAIGLWGLDGAEPGYMEIATTRAHSPELRGVIVHRSTDLVAAHTTIRRGVPVTKPMRTLIDACAVLPFGRAELALDHALGTQLVSLKGMWITLDEVARRGRRGVGPMRTMLGARGYAPAGVFEAAVMRLFRRRDLRNFTFEKTYTKDRQFIARVDASHNYLPLVAEFDGFASHSSPAELQYDHERQNKIVRRKLTILRYTPRDIFMRPTHVVDEIRETIAELSDSLILGTPTHPERGSA